ncbi:MAG: asparagine synthase (glutamine-hydrolyzing) [Deltaproteobacteria bacterium]|nr:asparagine synthase (glutamine-hydrolyzing) [Deltaproteobacteria bacterium]
MCGISGFLEAGPGAANAALEAVVRSMALAIAHRGPDDAGAWADASAGVALGHRRLSILDLSPEGHQPMVSRDERFVVVFNGEIYNFAALRAELEQLGHRFRGHSDTEVMLAAFSQWGCEPSLRRFAGMFAFALWDREARLLHLARDRLGEKPLYYGWCGATLVFGSELRALEKHPAFRREPDQIDRGALALLLRYNCIPAPHTIYKNVRKLPPGALLTFRAESASSEATRWPAPAAYWSAVDVASRGAADPLKLSDAAARDELDKTLRHVVGEQMVADVDLGAFLSGGVDSSTIVALMQAQSKRPVKTFTIGFSEEGYDEAAHAREVARHLGTEHTELYVGARELLDVVPRLATMYDEPFSDSSQIPTFLVSQLARKHVTVSLSGDGGDEIFAGYNRYLWAPRIWRRMRPVPRPLRAAVAAAMRALPEPVLRAALALASPLLPAMRLPMDKIHKALDVLDCASMEEIYLRLRSHLRDPASVVLGATEPASPSFPVRADLRGLQCLDALTYLPDDILAKVDRAAMAVSLESRVPFLDHRVVELAWRLPEHQRVRDGQGKWLLRQVLYQYVPRELVERPKAGFAVPVGAWLRNELRDWAEAQLSETRLRNEGFFDAGLVRARWDEHLSGRRDWQYHLWDVLMFQAWLARDPRA